ncbi:MAG: amidohydrolase [Symbiobacteriaceae bacterium]|nr:amidohydrolase [Symbiobacteriaceae bacterium]
MAILIKGGKVYTIANGVLEKGDVLIEGCKIKAVAAEIPVQEGWEVIDACGKTVMPGIIDSHSHLSLFGDPSIPATSDGNEMTNWNTAQLRGSDALNPEDPAIKEVVEAGVTAVYTGPGSANIIGGTGFVMKLRGRTADEMIIPGTEAMKFAIGENPKRVYGEGKKQYPATRMGIAAALREALLAGQHYLKKIETAEKEGKPLPDRDLKLEAVGKVLKRELVARMHAHRADDILTCIRIAEEFNLDYIIEHCTEGYKIADILAEKKVRATIGPLLMGHSKHELWNVTLENPAILAKAGVTITLQADTSAGTKWLPMHVGLAMREGLPEEDAFRAVTLTAAEILGLGDRMGSLEPGKDADIAIFDGFPFSNLTSCEMVFIDGKVIYKKGCCDCGC